MTDHGRVVAACPECAVGSVITYVDSISHPSDFSGSEIVAVIGA